MREACKFNVWIHNRNILMSSVAKDPGVSSILLFSGSGINFPRPLYFENFLRPLFCLFLVKSAKIRPEIFFCGPFWAFWPEFLPGNLATLNSSGGLGGGGGRGVTCPTSPNSHLADTCRKISTWNTQSWDFRKIIILSLSLSLDLDRAGALTL